MHKKTDFIRYKVGFVFGRGEKIRTSDPLHPMQVRYQAALRPETGIKKGGKLELSNKFESAPFH